MPESTVLNRESFCRFVSPAPSPVNAVATTEPLNLDSPITRSLNPFAVEPIPTPLPSTQNTDVPEPTFRVQSPGPVVPIPIVSNTTSSEPSLILTLPNLLHAFSVV